MLIYGRPMKVSVTFPVLLCLFQTKNLKQRISTNEIKFGETTWVTDTTSNVGLSFWQF